MRQHLDPLKLRATFGRKAWLVPVELGRDSWKMVSRDGTASVIVSCLPWPGDPEGGDWVHASIARPELPTYDDLVTLHAAVFGAGYAYQVFAPPSAHVNLHPTALHLWGRLDGQNTMPDFGQFGTI